MNGTTTLSNYFGWAQAVQYTGLSETTLRRLVRQGKVKAYRPSAGRTLLSRADIDEYIRATQLQPAEVEVG